MHLAEWDCGKAGEISRQLALATVLEIILAADEINLSRIKSASNDTYQAWPKTERATDWIVFSETHQSYMKLDNVVRGLT